MFFGTDRSRMRRYFCEVWSKHTAGQPLEPLERIIAGVIAQHPEYHTLLTGTEALLERDYLLELGEANPFLHMGLHIAIQEQLSSNRPAGILSLYQGLCQRFGDSHTAAHQMMECLGQTLWEAQRKHREPDAALYLQRLERLVQGD
jgi:hypothetical protein